MPCELNKRNRLRADDGKYFGNVWLQRNCNAAITGIRALFVGCGIW